MTEYALNPGCDWKIGRRPSSAFCVSSYTSPAYVYLAMRPYIRTPFPAALTSRPTRERVAAQATTLTHPVRERRCGRATAPEWLPRSRRAVTIVRRVPDAIALGTLTS